MKKIMATLLATILTALTMLAVLTILTGCSSTNVLAMLAISTREPLPSPAPTGGTSLPAPTPKPTWTPTAIVEPYPVPIEELILLLPTVDPYPAPDLPAHNAGNTCTVSTGKENGLLNLRSCAGNDCSVLAILHEGDELIVLDAGTWLHVLAGETAGYVLERYCK